MVTFERGRGYKEKVFVAGVLVGFIDKEGFSTNEQVIKRDVLISPNDLRTLSNRIEEIIARKLTFRFPVRLPSTKR